MVDVTQGLTNLKGKGLFVYVKGRKRKTDKWNKTRYYKIKSGTTIEPYIEYYTKKYIKGLNKTQLKKVIENYNKKIQKQEKQKQPKIPQKNKIKINTPRKYLDSIKNKGIHKKIDRGITGITIHKLHHITQHKLHEAKKTLLRPLIRDPQILDIIAKDENFKKIKSRLETTLTFKTWDGTTIGTAIGTNKTPEEVKRDIEYASKIGEEVQRLRTPMLATKLAERGYQPYEHENDGRIAQVSAKILFRKG